MSRVCTHASNHTESNAKSGLTRPKRHFFAITYIDDNSITAKSYRPGPKSTANPKSVSEGG
jgi:hypothetical protein